MDYIPIQASSVPCERAFSSSAETDTSRRNRITPLLMEVLQMLKYGFRSESESMDFTGDLLTPETELTVETNQDLLAELISVARENVVRENMMDRIVMEIEQPEEEEF
jgi:hypothetical protein